MDKDFSFLDMAKRQDPSLEPDSKGRTLRRIPKTDVLVLKGYSSKGILVSIKT